MRWPPDRDQELLDGLLGLWAAASGKHVPGTRVPGVVAEFLEALHAESTSGTGSAPDPGARLEVVQGVTADAAGAAVGMTGRQVRNICRAGRVLYALHGNRYLVDLADLRRHLRERA